MLPANGGENTLLKAYNFQQIKSNKKTPQTASEAFNIFKFYGRLISIILFLDVYPEIIFTFEEPVLK